MYYKHLVLNSFILSEHSDLTVCYSPRQYDFITFPQHFFAAGFIIAYPAGNQYFPVYPGADFIYAGISLHCLCISLLALHLLGRLHSVLFRRLILHVNVLG